MNYYQHHIGDFMRDTAHLSPVEECFYRRALDWYYVNEKPLPLDLDQVNRYLRAKTKTDRTAIGIVLSDFFKKLLRVLCTRVVKLNWKNSDAKKMQVGKMEN